MFLYCDRIAGAGSACALYDRCAGRISVDFFDVPVGKEDCRILEGFPELNIESTALTLPYSVINAQVEFFFLA